MNKLFLASKRFLDNFSLDFDKLAKELHKIMECNLSLLGIDKNMSVSFEECDLFGKSSSVSKTNISLNKTRIEMLVGLKIDDTAKDHLKRIAEFARRYEEMQNISLRERAAANMSF